jgi:lipoprotein NlpI/transglutaminase-like putative cysteine protease
MMAVLARNSGMLDGYNRMTRTLAWLLVVWVAAIAPQTAAATEEASRQISKSGFSFQIEPVPDWYVPAAETPNTPVDRAAMHYRIIDEQTQLLAATRCTHWHIVRVLDEVAGLGTASQIEIQFDPSYQTLVMHHLFIVRDGKQIDKLDASRVELLQRETQLERRMYDGRVTASIVLQDVRVADQIDIDYSIRGANPVFDNRFEGMSWAVSNKGPVAQYQYRLIAPAARKIEYRSVSPDITVESKVTGGIRETVFRRASIPQFHMDPGAPYIAALEDQVQLSEYSGWPQVKSWARSLFAEPSGNSSALDAAAADIGRRSKDANVRLLDALKFVQTDIRYFGTELGVNTHKPTAPDKVLAQRFGDCKDKVLLLIALLRRLEIPASPVLVSTAFRARVTDLLPSPLAFDHVIVRVDIKGSIFWLDATRNHQTGALARRQSIGFGKGLWLGSESAAFADLPSPYDELRVRVEDVINIDRFTDDPQLESRIIYRGDLAELLREGMATQPLSEVETALGQAYSRIYPKIKRSAPPKIEDSQDDDALTIVQKFTVPDFWRLSEQGRLLGRVELWSLIDALRYPPMQSRRQPLAIGAPGVYEHRIVIQFPEDVVPPGPKPEEFEEGDASFDIHGTHENTPRKFTNEAVLQLRADAVEPGDWTDHIAKLAKVELQLGGAATIPTIPLSQAETIKAEVSALDADLRSGKIKAATEIQRDSLLRSVMTTRALQAGRLSMPLRAQELTIRGIAYENLGDPGKAFADFTDALNITPDSRDALSAAAVNALARNDPARAVELADRLLSANPRDFEALFIRAKAHYASKQYPLAQQDLQEVLKDRSAVRRGYPLLFLYLTARRMGSDGKEVLARYAASDLPREWPRPLLDWVAGKTDAEGAVQSARSGTEAKEQLCEAYFYIGENYLANGDKRRAAEYFHRSVDQGVTEFYEDGAARNELALRGGIAR